MDEQNQFGCSISLLQCAAVRHKASFFFFSFNPSHKDQNLLVPAGTNTKQDAHTAWEPSHLPRRREGGKKEKNKQDCREQLSLPTLRWHLNFRDSTTTTFLQAASQTDAILLWPVLADTSQLGGSVSSTASLLACEQTGSQSQGRKFSWTIKRKQPMRANELEFIFPKQKREFKIDTSLTINQTFPYVIRRNLSGVRPLCRSAV